jgi:poly(3-hydroxybutyrate) depolymerase
MDRELREELGKVGVLSTSDVPSQYHEAAFLTGKIPFRISPFDSRVSYGMYVPPKHYNHQKPLPLLVYIHGTRRNTSAIHNELISFAQATPCALLAPLFPVGLDGPNDINSYQLLRSQTLQADTVLSSILDEVAYIWPGIETKKIFLMGFSGGGQFAHRFLYLHPERLAAISIGSPGSVTYLDQHPWPKGVGNVASLFGRPVSFETVRQVPIQLVVGGSDTALTGGSGLYIWLLKMKSQRSASEDPTSVKEQYEPSLRVKSRLDVLPQLQAQWKEEGINSQLDIVEGVAHRSTRVQDIVLKFIQPLMKTAAENLTVSG